MDEHASRQDILRVAWLAGSKDGPLPAREQAKAWAFRELWPDSGKGSFGMLTYIASKLEKNTGGSPTAQAVGQLFAKMDADSDWFPGKANYTSVGAPGLLTGPKRTALARCAMALKAKGVEPTYGRIIAACPRAAANPRTKQPFSKATVYSVLKDDCYDDDPCFPWQHKFRFSKVALTEDQMRKRHAFATFVARWGHNAKWYFRNVVWADLCSSIVPLSEKKANEMALALKGKKGWQSPGSELSSPNLCGSGKALSRSLGTQ